LSFWIQVPSLPLQNMTAINAIKIGETLGPLLEVENGEVPGIICRHHLRIKVEIDTSKPLVPGFHFPRVGRDPIWVRFLYERLANYHILYGLIGHKKKKNGCSAPPLPLPQVKYGLSLKATIFSSSRLSSGPQMDAHNLAKFVAGSSSLYPMVISPFEASSAITNGGELALLQLVP
jgi:hypothetical protein